MPNLKVIFDVFFHFSGRVVSSQINKGVKTPITRHVKLMRQRDALSFCNLTDGKVAFQFIYMTEVVMNFSLITSLCILRKVEVEYKCTQT